MICRARVACTNGARSRRARPSFECSHFQRAQDGSLHPVVAPVKIDKRTTRKISVPRNLDARNGNERETGGVRRGERSDASPVSRLAEKHQARRNTESGHTLPPQTGDIAAVTEFHLGPAASDDTQLAKYPGRLMSAIMPISFGFHPSHFCVSALEAGPSIPANIAAMPKCSGAFSGEIDTTGSFS